MQPIHVRDLIDKFENELLRLKYRESTLRNYRIFWKQLFAYFEQRKECYFSERVALDFLETRYKLSEKAQTRSLTRNEIHVRQMVRKLTFFHAYEAAGRMNGIPESQIKKKSFLEILKNYARYCLEYGYSYSSRRNLRNCGVKFFAYLEKESVHNISDITSRTIVKYVNSLTTYGYHTVGLILTSIRCLLRFVHEQGYTSQNFAAALPHQQERVGGTVPAVWSREEVLKLLKAIDRGNPGGKRDYAIFILIALLGMRAGDVRTLKLENLKWNINQIEFVQSKTARTVSLPLLKDIGWAIIDYLKNGRPKVDSPFLFLRHIAPYDGLSEGNCFYNIISRCMRISRIIPPDGNKRGMHSLRHTLASMLLGKQTPLSTISGILGHTSVESTSVYLKTDIESLRECALAEPEAVQ